MSRDLDIEVAEQVMGLTKQRDCPGGDPELCPGIWAGGGESGHLKRYSSMVDEAMGPLCKVRTRPDGSLWPFTIKEYGDREYHCEVRQGGMIHFGRGATIAEAVSLCTVQAAKFRKANSLAAGGVGEEPFDEPAVVHAEGSCKS